MSYQAIDFNRLHGMEGFSQILLDNHFTLYQGYVTNTNKLIDILSSMAEKGEGNTPEYAEVKRRFGFEFNGMRLHEYYFGNLCCAGDIEFVKQAIQLGEKLEQEFGGYEKWEEDFKNTGKMRGIGWVVLYKDNVTGRLFNQWINEHETGHLAGCKPILVMDVFEHAFITDYGLNRAGYIEAFFKNIDWAVVERRLLSEEEQFTR